jgi:hypothetical protein
VDQCLEDGGYVATTSLFAASSLAPVGTFDGFGSFDPTGTWLWEAHSQSGADVIRVSDGTVVASPADAPAISPASFDPSGVHAFYATTGGALKQLTLSPMPPTTTVLESSGFSESPAVNANGQYLLDDATLGGDAGGSAMVLLAATSGASLHAIPVETPARSAFTTDGKYVLSISGGNAVSTAMSGASTVAATGVIEGFLLLAGAKALFEGTSGTGFIVDASGSSPARDFAPSFVQVRASKSGTQFAYVTAAQPAGLYVVGL